MVVLDVLLKKPSKIYREGEGVPDTILICLNYFNVIVLINFISPDRSP